MAITVVGWLRDYGFTQCVSDLYLFVLRKGESLMYLIIWVDDVFLGLNCQRDNSRSEFSLSATGGLAGTAGRNRFHRFRFARSW